MTSKLWLRKKLILIAAITAIALACVAFLSFHKSRAPEALFTSLKGEKFTMTDLRGKVVLVNFWATSCVTCIKEMPDIVSTYKKYSPYGFETIAIAMSYDPPNYVLNYAKSNELPFKVVLDVQGDLADSFGKVRVTPTTFIINKKGVIIQQIIGEPNFTELQKLLDDLILQPA